MAAADNPRLIGLRKRRTFLGVAAARRSCRAAGLVLQVAPSAELHRQTYAGKYIGEDLSSEAGNGIHVGFTASKKVGNAVRRNRAKRRLRALSKDILPFEALPDHSYVLIARHTTPERPWDRLLADLRYCLHNLGVAKRSSAKQLTPKQAAQPVPNDNTRKGHAIHGANKKKSRDTSWSA